jgi:hypothetical protein
MDALHQAADDPSAFSQAVHDQGLCSLQELTESVVASREERTQLSLELVVPTIVLAQKIAEQLHAYGFSSQDLRGTSTMLACGRGVGGRTYQVQYVQWKAGSWPRRRTRKAIVLIGFKGGTPYLLWDPRTSDINWDINTPPWVNLLHHKRGMHLADVNDLTAWAADALPLLARLRERECERTELVREGVKLGLAAISELQLG